MTSIKSCNNCEITDITAEISAWNWLWADLLLICATQYWNQLYEMGSELHFLQQKCENSKLSPLEIIFTPALSPHDSVNLTFIAIGWWCTNGVISTWKKACDWLVLTSDLTELWPGSLHSAWCIWPMAMLGSHSSRWSSDSAPDTRKDGVKQKLGDRGEKINERKIILNWIAQWKLSITRYNDLFNCLSLFLVLIGQKSITWQMVFCATTGDDVSRSLFDWADRSLFTRARPIDSVLQVWLTRAESASAQLAAAARFLIVCWLEPTELSV